MTSAHNAKYNDDERYISITLLLCKEQGPVWKKVELDPDQFIIPDDYNFKLPYSGLDIALIGLDQKKVPKEMYKL